MDSSSTCMTTLSGAVVPSGFCAYEIPVAIDQPRGILAMGETDFVTVERGTSSVILMSDTDNDGIPDTRRTVVTAENLTHGLAIHQDYLYASSDSEVYRWKINNNNGDLSQPLGARETIIFNMNDDGQGGQEVGNHPTRTLVFDDRGRLYISVGSLGNIDPNSFRSRIRRLDMASTDPTSFPMDFVDLEVFADGVRNEVGLAFDNYGVLWGVENSADMLFREDLGGDIVEDNPVSAVILQSLSLGLGRNSINLTQNWPARSLCMFIG